MDASSTELEPPLEKLVQVTLRDEYPKPHVALHSDHGPVIKEETVQFGSAGDVGAGDLLRGGPPENSSCTCGDCPPGRVGERGAGGDATGDGGKRGGDEAGIGLGGRGLGGLKCTGLS